MPVKSRCLGRGDGVVGFLAGGVVVGVLADDGGTGRLLAGGMLDLDDAGVFFVVGIVHLHGGLPEAGLASDELSIPELFRAEGLVLEAEGSVGKRAEAVVEVFVDGAGDDEVVILHLADDVAVVGVEDEVDTGGCGKHALEHAVVAFSG